MYKFCTDISEQECLQYLQTLPHYNVLQTPMWAQVKPNWTHQIVGVRNENGELVATALLLIRKLMPGIRIIYSPRGFMVDYHNPELLKTMVNGVLEVAKKRKAYVVRIDPEIEIAQIYKGQKVSDEAGLEAMNELKKQGFLHMGFATDFHSYTQPRFYAVYALTDDDGQKKTDEQILSGFDKKLKKFIGHYTHDRGIFFEKAENTEQTVDDYVAISAHTEQRQHILLRDAEYFKRMMQAFGEDMVIYFGKMNIDLFLQFLQQQPQNDQTQKDRAEALRIQSERGNIVPMSALLFLKSKDTAYLMYSGFDDSIFPRFRTTNQIRYEAMRQFRDMGLKTFSFMGIHGDLQDSLSEFKLKFNPVVKEFAGEFEYPVSKMKYKIMTKIFPFCKTTYLKLVKLFRKK